MANIVVQSVIDDFMQSQSAEAARAAIGAEQTGAVFIVDLEVEDPSGVVDADEATVGSSTDGTLWYNPGSGLNGWVAISEPTILDGGGF